MTTISRSSIIVAIAGLALAAGVLLWGGSAHAQTINSTVAMGGHGGGMGHGGTGHGGMGHGGMGHDHGGFGHHGSNDFNNFGWGIGYPYYGGYGYSYPYSSCYYIPYYPYYYCPSYGYSGYGYGGGYGGY